MKRLLALSTLVLLGAQCTTQEPKYEATWWLRANVTASRAQFIMDDIKARYPEITNSFMMLDTDWTAPDTSEVPE